LTRIEHTVTIARPVEEVFEFLMDTRNDPVWMTHVVEVGRNADVPVEPGLEVDETIKFLGKRLPITMTVTEHDPPRRSAIEVAGVVPGRGSYDLEPAGDGTRLTATLETDAHGFFRLAEPVFARMARRDFIGNFETLKDLLEARNDSRTHGP
jgi:carbon monoxide dehydrogenase subunit G